MSTAKQRAASRANAQKSTGPRTAEGKAASRFNAVKHGIFAASQIMFEEKADDLAELAAEYHDHYQPATPQERFLVDELIHNEWRLRRLRRVEADLWDVAGKFFLAENADAATCSAADAFARGETTFDRLQRIVNSCERSYHRSARELQRLQSERAPADPPQPEESIATSASLASFRPPPPFPPEMPRQCGADCQSAADCPSAPRVPEVSIPPNSHAPAPQH